MCFTNALKTHKNETVQNNNPQIFAQSEDSRCKSNSHENKLLQALYKMLKNLLFYSPQFI